MGDCRVMLEQTGRLPVSRPECQTVANEGDESGKPKYHVCRPLLRRNNVSAINLWLWVSLLSAIAHLPELGKIIRDLWQWPNQNGSSCRRNLAQTLKGLHSTAHTWSNRASAFLTTP